MGRRLKSAADAPLYGTVELASHEATAGESSPSGRRLEEGPEPEDLPKGLTRFCGNLF